MTLVVPLQHDNYFQLFCGIFIQLFSQFGSQSMSVVFGINTTELKLKKKLEWRGPRCTSVAYRHLVTEKKIENKKCDGKV